MQKIQGLPVDIYRNNHSESYYNAFCDKKSVIIAGLIELREANVDTPAVIIKTKTRRDGTPYLYAEPIEPGSYAMGGAFIYSSDSRYFEKYSYPIPLHDRRMDLEQRNPRIVVLFMRDTNTGKEVTRSIDISNLTAAGTSNNYRQNLEDWIEDRGNEQHATTLELISWTLS